MAFTEMAVFVGIIVASLLLVSGIIVLFITKNNPHKRKWGYLLIVLCVCALISAVVNSAGVFY